MELKKSPRWLLLSAALALQPAPQVGAQDASHPAPLYPYKVTVLVPFTPGQGSGVANIINNHGLICGFLISGAGFCYRHGAITQLLPLAGDAIGIPTGLNDRGQVVGFSRDSNGNDHAVIFVHGAARLLAVGSHRTSRADDINNAGQIVGGFGDVQDESLAFMSRHGNVQPLGTLGGPRHIDEALGNNDRGQIVGLVSEPGTRPEPGLQVAFLYEKGVMRALSTPTDYASSAVRINIRGQAVGYTYKTNEEATTKRAALWDKGVLKTLLDEPSDARDINRWGQVVGGRFSSPGGFLYEPGRGTRNLNTLIDPASGFTVAYAQGINDRGQIVGFGCKEQLCGPIMLDPVRPHALTDSEAGADSATMSQAE
jgi:probable HAF family extracellular repeat protein